MKLFSPFLKILNQLRIYHWQTPNYAQHKAFDQAYEDFGELVDSFIESYLGRYGNNPVKMVFKFEVTSYDEEYIKFIDDCVSFLTSLTNEVEDQAADLLNIKDEMIAVFTRLKYLLTLR